MAVISCIRDDKKSGQTSGDNFTLKDIYVVRCDATDEPSTILRSENPDVPKKRDPHPTDPSVLVQDVSVKHTDNRTVYILEVTYTNSSGLSSNNTNDMRLVDAFGGVWYEEFTLEKDFDGKLYRNTVGDKIQKQSRRPHPMITVITKSQALLLDRFVWEVGQTNDGPVSWLGLDFIADQLLFDDFQWRAIENDFWQYTFVFKGKLAPEQNLDTDGARSGRGRELGWIDQQLNAGFRERTTKGTITPIILKDNSGKRTSTTPSDPWPLDGQGKALDLQEDGRFLDNRLVWLNFREFPKMNFGIFNFDFTPLLTRVEERNLGL